MTDDAQFPSQYEGTTDFRGADVHLGRGKTERIARERLSEPLFHYAARNQMLNAHQMLEALLRQTNSRLQHYLPHKTLDEALATGEGRATPVFEANITDGFKYLQDGKLVDFEKLSFDIEMIVRPRGLAN